MLLEEAVPTYHVSGTPSYLEQDVARWQDRLACCLKKLFQRITYQERLASYLKKMLLEEAVPTYHVSGTPCKLLEEDVTTCHVSGTSCKLLDEDVTTYQERLASYLKKMLQRIRNVFQVT